MDRESYLDAIAQANIGEMEQYHLYNVVPALFDFIKDLTNWYIRLNQPGSGLSLSQRTNCRLMQRCIRWCRT